MGGYTACKSIELQCSSILVGFIVMQLYHRALCRFIRARLLLAWLTVCCLFIKLMLSCHTVRHICGFQGTDIYASTTFLARLPRFDNATLRLVENDAIVEAKEVNIQEPVLYGDAWTFLVPDLTCDTVNGLLWKVHLDLEAMSTSSSEVSSILEFLQRRKLEAIKAKQLCLAITRTIILEHRPVSIVSKALDVLITSYSLALKNGCYLKGIKSDKAFASSDSHSRRSRIPVDESFDASPQRKSVKTEFYTKVDPFKKR